LGIELLLNPTVPFRNPSKEKARENCQPALLFSVVLFACPANHLFRFQMSGGRTFIHPVLLNSNFNDRIHAGKEQQKIKSNYPQTGQIIQGRIAKFNFHREECPPGRKIPSLIDR
jgi:hypothetical protein